MLARFRKLSARNKARLVFYPSLVAAPVLFLLFCTTMPGSSFRGPLPALDDAGHALASDLRKDVVALTATGQRNTSTPGTLARGAAMLDAAFASAGYAVKRLPYDADGVKVENLEATIEGASRVVVVGAHYDSAIGAPGADDNASGVAALLALARMFHGSKPGATLRFVAFVNEEPPHFWNPTMGSLVYAKACKARGDDVVAMLSLETLGYYRDEPGTQQYPPVVRWLYPSTGNFVGFVGDLGSRGLVRDAVRTFRGSASFPSEGASLPGFVTGVGWSDQWSFWQVGYPGVMVTDTAPFRNPNYHHATDTADTLDYDRLARVTRGLEAVIRALAK